MIKIDFSKALVRSSKIGDTMTEPKGCITAKQLEKLSALQEKQNGKGLTAKQLEELAQLILKREESEDEPLSEACQVYLMELYSYYRYGRKFRDKLQDLKQIMKGTQVEEDSLDLIALLDKRHYKKNDERLKNEFFEGEPDVFLGESILQATWIEDVKSSWDMESFLPQLRNELNPSYWWQLQGYFALTGAQEGAVSFCLVNTPESLQNDERMRLLRKMDVATELNPKYVKAEAELLFNMKFDDIPMEERRIRFFVKRDDEAIAKAQKRVGRCRKWLADFQDAHLSRIKQTA